MKKMPFFNVAKPYTAENINQRIDEVTQLKAGFSRWETCSKMMKSLNEV